MRKRCIDRRGPRVNELERENADLRVERADATSSRLTGLVVVFAGTRPARHDAHAVDSVAVRNDPRAAVNRIGVAEHPHDVLLHDVAGFR